MQILQRLRDLFRRDEGQDLIEYGLLVGMISAAIVATIPPIAAKVAQPFQQFVAAGSGGGNPGNGNPGNGNPGNGNPGIGNPGNSNPVGNAGPNPGNGNGNGNGN